MNPPIKMKLRSRGVIPHGGYFHVLDPLTGVRSSAVHWDHLVSKVRDERKANGAPIGLELEDEIEAWACLSHPDEVQVVDPRMPKLRSFNLDDVIRGTQVLAAFKLAGSPLVSQQEANRRAAVCAKCPLNVSYSQSCSICGKIEAVVMSVVGNVSTPSNQQLYSCAICSCALKAAVHLPNSILNQANNAEMNRDFAFAAEAFGCWHTESGVDEA